MMITTAHSLVLCLTAATADRSTTENDYRLLTRRRVSPANGSVGESFRKWPKAGLVGREALGAFQGAPDEDSVFFERILHDGNSLPTPLPTERPTKLPTTSELSCDPSCPCCDQQWDESTEFTAAVESYSEDDSCFSRVDDTSDIIALSVCDAGYDVAYFSYDYENYGGTKDEPVKYCGTSSSDRLLLDDNAADECEALIRNLAEEMTPGECVGFC